MRVLLLCCMLVGAGCGGALPVPAEETSAADTGAFYPHRSPILPPGAHDTAYLLPRLPLHNYRPATWEEMEYMENAVNEQEPELSSEERFKRAGPSLSIVNPLDVLRQRLLLEMARRQMRESSRQVAENRKLMQTIGKRNFLRQPDTHLSRNSIGYDTM